MLESETFRMEKARVLINISDLANGSGVSKSTVSNLLSYYNNGSVSIRLGRKVLTYLKGLP